MKTILVDAYNTSIIRNDAGQCVQFKELFDLLDTYPNPKIIVTNANDEQLVEFALTTVPYPVFTLKHNPDKPDPVFFRTLLEQYALKPEDVIYFEHNPDAVASAQSVGITAHHYDKDARDLVALKAFLDKNI
jgi:HAD superfamily hydrolase (TIGR01509 family)